MVGLDARSTMDLDVTVRGANHTHHAAAHWQGKKKDYAEYRRSCEEMRELLAAKANVDRLIGEFIDLQVIRTSRTSYQVTLIGRTPQKFIPVDGRAIAV